MMEATVDVDKEKTTSCQTDDTIKDNRHEKDAAGGVEGINTEIPDTEICDTKIRDKETRDTEICDTETRDTGIDGALGGQEDIEVTSIEGSSLSSFSSDDESIYSISISEDECKDVPYNYGQTSDGEIPVIYFNPIATDTNDVALQVRTEPEVGPRLFKKRLSSSSSSTLSSSNTLNFREQAVEPTRTLRDDREEPIKSLTDDPSHTSLQTRDHKTSHGETVDPIRTSVENGVEPTGKHASSNGFQSPPALKDSGPSRKKLRIKSLKLPALRSSKTKTDRDPGQSANGASLPTTRWVEPLDRRPPAKRNRSSSLEGSFRFPLPVPRKVRRWITEESSIEGKEIRITLMMGVSFQLVYTAHLAIQNLQSSVHDEGSLGVSALGCLYGTSIISCILAPTLIGVIGAKGCLVLAWLAHIIYTIAQFYPAWETLVPASILLGALNGPAWTAQGLYVSACAFSFSKRSDHSPYTILSRFNGLFFSLYETTQILGNLLSSVILQNGASNSSEKGLIFKYCGAEDCPSNDNITAIEDPHGWLMDILLGSHMALQILGLVIVIGFVTPLARSEWVARVTLRQTATSWFRNLVSSNMLLLAPFIIFQSMVTGILLVEYTKSFVSCPIGIHNVGFVMAAHGITTAALDFLISRLVRYTGRFILFALAATNNLALLLVLYHWTPDHHDEVLIFIIPVLWGLSEAVWQTQTNSMIALLFSEHKEPAFANYQSYRSVGYTLLFSIHSFLCVTTKLAIAMGFLCLGMVLYTVLEIRVRCEKRPSRPRSTSDEQQVRPISFRDLTERPGGSHLNVPRSVSFELTSNFLGEQDNSFRRVRSLSSINFMEENYRDMVKELNSSTPSETDKENSDNHLELRRAYHSRHISQFARSVSEEISNSSQSVDLGQGHGQLPRSTSLPEKLARKHRKKKAIPEEECEYVF